MTIVRPFVKSRRIVVTVLAIGVGLGAIDAAPAFAQGGADAPITGGLFAENGKKPRRQRFDFLLDSSESLNRQAAPFVRAVAPDSPQAEGYATLLKASSTYLGEVSRTQIQASASAAAQYFSSLNDTRIVSSAAALGLTTRLTRKTRLVFDQNVAYSPSYFYQLLPTAGAIPEPGALPTTAPDYSIGEFQSFSYGTRVSLADDAVAGGKVRVTGSVDSVDFWHSDVTRPNLLVYGLESDYSRPVSRSIELSAGYTHRSGELGYGGWTREQGATIGANYHRALSRTRRAELRVKVMPELIDIPETARLTATTGRQYRVSADASFAYPFYRTWVALASASRRLEYNALLPQPAFSDGGRLGIEGFVTRGTHVSLTAAYSKNKSAADVQPYYFDTYGGDAYVRYALTPKVGLYGGYLRYRYASRGDVAFLPGLPGRFERTGVRVGLMLFIPVRGR